MFNPSGVPGPFGTKPGPPSKKNSLRGPNIGSSNVGLFGMPPPSPIGAPASPQQSGFGGFPSTNPPPKLFGAGSGSILPPTGGPNFSAGGTNNPLFGGQRPSLLGQSPSTSSHSFGQLSTQSTAAPIFGQTSTTSSPGLTMSSSSLFGEVNSASSSLGHQPINPPFGQTASSNTLFGNSASPNLFGGQPTTAAAPPVFGPSIPGTTSIFGQTKTTTTSSSLFGQSEPIISAASSSSSLFGKSGNDTTVFTASTTRGPPASRPNTPVTDLVEEANMFKENNIASSGSSIFGTTTTSVTNVFGGPPVVHSSGDTKEKGEEGELLDESEDEQTDDQESNTDALSTIQSQVDNRTFGAPKASVKTRLGPTMDSGEGKPEFSKPIITKGNIFGQEEPQQLSETESEVSEGSVGGRRRIERTVSKEELSSIKSIICDGVPDVLNKSPLLARHFSKYGEVTKVVTNAKKKTATIHFVDHKSAKLAKTKGKTINPQMAPMKILYSQSSPGRKARLIRSSSRSDVNKELEAMGGVPVTKKKIFSITKALKGNKPSTTDQGGSTIVSSGVAVDISGQSSNELLTLMKQQTHSDGDRWSVLEARDKYVRLSMPRSQTRSGMDIMDINLVGTCPDFCPEKERYSRSAKNQLRWFEKIDGTLNHLASVKEHTRSAADQDIPLSHELRPPTVLKKTMDFLMCNIVDRISSRVGTMSDWFEFIDKLHMENLQPSDPMSQFYVMNRNSASETVADWFEFMWSVTRAVRKDIAQQNLKDLVSLSIVEKCARFHIFCAERLCEETPHDFDRKLNDENLTKCMQTLKHMYYDLSLDGEVCPQEEEFRAYDVLLKLNDGDTLREVQTLSEHLRQGSKVQFSLKCLNAVNNNYVKFFKLVRQASFLEGCILQRYFYQVRRRGIETIQHAFTPGKGMVNFPIIKLVDLLGFESELECGRFIRLHGIEYEEGIVFLERGTFIYPENQPPLTRSIQLIESKKDGSFGEVMNGGSLPENPYLEYYPHDSFDDNGFLNAVAYNAKDQEVTISPEELENMKMEEERRELNKAIAAEQAEEIVIELCDEQVVSIIDDVMTESQNKAEVEEVTESIEDEIVSEMIEQVALDCLRSARNKLLQVKMMEEQKLEEQEVVVNCIIDDLIMDEIKDVCNEEMASVQVARKQQKYLVVADEIIDNVVMETIKQNIYDLAKSVLSEALLDQEEKLRLFTNNLRKRQIRKLFYEWRRLAQRSTNQKAAVSNFPASPAYISVEEQNKRFGGTGTEHSRHPSLVSQLKSSEDLDQLFQLVELQDSLRQNVVLEPFQLTNWFQSYLSTLTNCPLSLSWKLLLSLPRLSEETDGHYDRPFLQMIRMKFRKSLPCNDDNDNPNLLLCQTKPIDRTLVSICVREVGQETIENVALSEKLRREILSGTSGIMFVFIDEEESISDATKRLESLLVNKPRVPAVPLAFLTTLHSSDINRMFDLGRYVNDGVISSFDINSLTMDIFNVSQTAILNKSIEHLISKIPEDPTKHLCRKNLRDFIEDFLASNVFSEYFSNLKTRRSQDLVDRGSADLISLYNCGLDHLSEVAKDVDLQEISWPVQEFSHLGLDSDIPTDWNSSFHVDPMVQLIDSLKLPDMMILPSCSWKDIVQQVMVYLDKITESGTDSSVVWSSVSRALSRTYRIYQTRCCSKWGGEETIPPTEALPWTDIVHGCIQLKLMAIPSQLADSIICYREEILAAFQPPSQWTGGLGWGAEHKEDTMWSLVDDSVCEARERSMVEQGPATTNTRLRDLMKKEQKQSVRFENMLENALDEDYVPVINNSNDKSNENSCVDEATDIGDRSDKSTKNLVEPADLSLNFVPVISFISPSLGQLVSPLQFPTRSERLSREMSPRYSTTPIAPQMFSTPLSRPLGYKRKAEAEKCSNGIKKQAGEMSMSIEQKLEKLQSRLESDMEQDKKFERRLQAALLS